MRDGPVSKRWSAFGVVRESGPLSTDDVAREMGVCASTAMVDLTILLERGILDHREKRWYLAGERRCPRCNDWIPLEVTNMSAKAVCDLCRGFESEEPEPLGYEPS